MEHSQKAMSLHERTHWSDELLSMGRYLGRCDGSIGEPAGRFVSLELAWWFFLEGGGFVLAMERGR